VSRERVHLASPVLPLCKTTDALQRRTTDLTEVTCPFCSALFLADHPEYRASRETTTDEGQQS
jgi:hypothetical protein